MGNTQQNIKEIPHLVENLFSVVCSIEDNLSVLHSSLSPVLLPALKEISAIGSPSVIVNTELGGSLKSILERLSSINAMIVITSKERIQL